MSCDLTCVRAIERIVAHGGISSGRASQNRFIRPRILFVIFSISSSFFNDDNESTKRSSFSRSSSKDFERLTKSRASRTFCSYSALRISSCCLLPFGRRTSSGWSFGVTGGVLCAGRSRAARAAGTKARRARRARKWLAKSPISVSYPTYE